MATFTCKGTIVDKHTRGWKNLAEYYLESLFVNPSRERSWYDERKTIPIFGTKGEERSAIRFGYLSFKQDDIDHRLNLYANIGKDSTVYYSIWFTDKRTNIESYGVGRYLSFELESNKDHEYTIDFNNAFNPYCSYSSDYSCAIPAKEDYIDLAISAGEKKYHD